MFADTLPASIIKGLSIRARELGAVNLGQGIPSFPTAPHILDAAQKALEDPTIGVYPNFLGEIELREAIATRLHQQYGADLSAAKHILVTVGAMEGTAAAILALVETGDRVGIITPDYCNHLPQVMLARGTVVEIPMVENHQWSLDMARIEVEAKKGLKLLIVTNPSNPTGSILSKTDLDRLVGLARQYGFWILSDETYAFLSYDGPYTSLLSYWGSFDQMLVVRSFSKEYAMTGWRVGFVVAADSAIAQIAKVHDALTGCVPKISQRAAIAALTGSQEIVVQYQQILSKRRDLATKLFATMGDLTVCIRPQGAYYGFTRYRAKIPSLQLAEELLTRAGVAVIPGVAFGAGGENHLRISFAVEDAVLTDGLTRLGAYLSQIS